MFCCTLCVRSSIAIILVGTRELVALLNLSSCCFVMVGRLFLAVPQAQGCLRFVIVVFPDHTHLLFCISVKESIVTPQAHDAHICKTKTFLILYRSTCYLEEE